MRLEHWLYAVPLRIRSLFKRSQIERELNEELQYHLEQQTRQNVAQGMSADEARCAALRALGGVEQHKEAVRDTWKLRWLTDLAQDLRYALRGFRRRRGLAATVIMVLALGIGANTAVYTVLYRVLFASLPVTDPQELVELGCVNTFDPNDVGCNQSYPGYLMFRQEDEYLTGIFAYAPFRDVFITYRGSKSFADGLLATGEMFDTLGGTPALGRFLTQADDDSAAPPVAVLNFDYWQRAFGGDTGVIGETIGINNQAFTVVGVAQPGFRGVTLGVVADVVLPMQVAADSLRGTGILEARDNWWLRIMARRHVDASPQQIEARMEPIFRRTLDDMRAAVSTDVRNQLEEFIGGRRFVVQSASSGTTSEFRRDLDQPLRILMVAVTLVLIIACINLMGLMQVHAAGRHREFSFRIALGAGPARVIRQVLTETLLLSMAGAVIAFLLAWGAGGLLVGMAAGDVGLRALDTQPDATMLGFTAAVSLAAALFIGLVPALRLSRTDPHSVLHRDGCERAPGRRAHRLIVFQVALATILLIAATVFIQTFQNLRHVDLGFPGDRLLTFRPSPALAGYDGVRIRNYFDELVERLEAIPDVRSATVSNAPPTQLANTTVVEVPEFAQASLGERTVGRYFVGAKYFGTIGLPVLRGRDLSVADTTTEDRIAIVNESFAMQFFGTMDAVGRSFSFIGQPDPRPFRVVGVVADARERGPKNPTERVVYEPVRTGSTVIVQARGRVGSRLISAVNATVADIDPAVPIRSMQTVETLAHDQLGHEKLLATLSGIFGILALLLVGVGLYGVIAAAVASRTAELGVRVAMGAQPASLVRLLIAETVVLVATGMSVGLAAGGFLVQYVRSELFGITAENPALYLSAAIALIATAVLAAYFPVRRAIRFDPMEALRHE